jgi:hypothetical protein
VSFLCQPPRRRFRQPAAFFSQAVHRSLRPAFQPAPFRLRGGESSRITTEVNGIVAGFLGNLFAESFCGVKSGVRIAGGWQDKASEKNRCGLIKPD